MQRDIPIGTIQSWSGSIVDIPSTWRLCDGSKGTPDLRNKFVTGAGDSYAVGAKSGSLNHVHPYTGDSHAHIVNPGATIKAGTDFTKFSSFDPVTGTSDASSSLPPYYALAYIMYTGRPR